MATTRTEIIPIGCRPWSASGPGWSNRGVYITVREFHDNRQPVEREVCIYAEDLPCDAAVLDAAIVLCRRLSSAAAEALARREAKE